jgi:hypothetical protein
MKTIGSSILLILILIIGLTPFSILPSVTAQSSQTVSGIISSDTTWTKANSPYSLSGPVAVNQGVTLTIEAGTIINLNYFYIQINGTLVAKGTSADKIQFDGGSSQGITFTAVSSKWNEQTGSGCIIQYATIKPLLLVSGSSVKIDHSNVLSALTVGGSSVITNNNLQGGACILGSTMLSNNIISGTSAAGPVAPAPVVIATSDTTLNEFPTIANNLINGRGGEIGISCSHYVKVTNNSITGCQEGIRIFSSQISGYPVIEKNAIFCNQNGIVILASQGAPVSDQPLIESNLITGNNIGISVERDGGISTPTIQNNNIYSNNVNLGWGPSNNMDIVNNWWGTTDTQAINQTISDFKNDFNQGKVNFVPFLAQPNPDAPILSPGVSPTPSPTPEIPEFSLIVIITALISVAVLVGILKKRKSERFD